MDDARFQNDRKNRPHGGGCGKRSSHPAANGSKWLRPAKRMAIYARDGHRCVYCGGNGDDSKLTLDHLLPVELGGTNVAKNLVTCCIGCNSAKGKKSLRRFLDWLSEKGIDIEEVKIRIRRLRRRTLRGYSEGVMKK